LYGTSVSGFGWCWVLRGLLARAPRGLGLLALSPLSFFAAAQQREIFCFRPEGSAPSWAGSMVLTKAWCLMPCVRRLGASKGQPQASPGQRPGFPSPNNKSPEGARHSRHVGQSYGLVRPFGLGWIGAVNPGLPRAGVGRAVGASGRARRRMSESMACLGDWPDHPAGVHRERRRTRKPPPSMSHEPRSG
jgi:hypothetical protein